MSNGKKEKSASKIAQNKKARHDYFIEEVIEAGIQLHGTEVKSLRKGRVNIRDSYASISDNEVFLNQMHISPYENGNIFNKDPLRKRKLLLHRSQIRKLIGYVAQKGYSLVPLSLYFKNSRVKVELSVAKGKKLYDKRQDIMRKTVERDISRAIKNY